tara:strand:- start:958 stop:1854 length:897 start_codon:yes stop_codon:yes gene_type:complete
MGFLAGVVKELNRQEDAATRADEFMQSLLEKRKNEILPELMERIADRTESATERTARIDTAMGLGFSERAATALELTGQLEFQLAKVIDLKKDLDPTYIPNLTSGLEARIDDDEALAKAVSEGLSGPLKSREDQERAFVRAYQATDQSTFDTELANLIGYMGSKPRSIDEKFDITASKGSVITDTEFKNINSILGNALNVMYEDMFERTNDGDWYVKSEGEGSEEVQFLFNNLSKKATEISQDPFNTLGTVGAAQFVIDKITPASQVEGLEASLVNQYLDEALKTPDFSWNTVPIPQD